MKLQPPELANVQCEVCHGYTTEHLRALDGDAQLLQIRCASLLIGKPGAKLLPRSRIRRVNFRSWRISQHYI